MPIDQDEIKSAKLGALPDGVTHEFLTDVIDQLARNAFQLALDRRHASPSYRTVIQSAQLVETTPQ